MSNMRFCNSNGTYNFESNPTEYMPDEVSLEDNERMADAGLKNYNKGIYHTFFLSFDNIGTAQEANFGTFFRAKQNITFYPFDENHGTAVFYTVRWLGNYGFKLADSFWGGGYQGSIALEEV